MALHWSERPTLSLGLLTQTVLPETWIAETVGFDGDYPMSQALARWYALNHLMMNARSDVERMMHPEQLQSYLLLFDWWTAAYQDPGLSLSAILAIVSQSDDLEKLAAIETKADHPTAVERQFVFRNILRHLELRSWPKEKTLETPSRSLPEGQYHWSMLQLFESEFSDLYEQGNLDAKSGGVQRHKRRNDAIASAYCQQFAANLYATKTCRWITPPSTLDVLERGPALDSSGCSWLPALPDDRATCMPYYLWDIHKRRTVCSADLFRDGVPRSPPPYACISHTWGRWRLKDRPKATIAGVPWPVPRNTKFRVEDLPILLHHAPCKTRYVWLDLLCIPQDRSVLGQREIARQGEIFRGAQNVIIWLNDTPPNACSSGDNGDFFSALRSLLAYIALHFLRFPSGSVDQHRQDQLVQQSLEEVSGKSSSLFFNHPWFTSLWTLQEVCLRSDMWLCDGDWSVLSIDGRSALPVNGLICVLHKFMNPDCALEAPGFGVTPAVLTYQYYDRAENLPFLAFRELRSWYETTGFGVLLNLSRIDILNLGNRRNCTGRRAEAIMSALGATDWFDPACDNERDILLGKYPFSFVQELQKKFPGEFFSSVSHSGSKTLTTGGSLLPFTRDARLFITHKTSHSQHTLPSLSTWTVEPTLDGSVRIGRACILSSRSIANSHHTTHKRERLFALFQPLQVGPALWPEADLPHHDEEAKDELYYYVDDLHAWVRERTYDVYFVATQYHDEVFHWKSDIEELSDRNMEIRGLVFRGDDTQSLVKMGSFEARFHSNLDPVDEQEREFQFSWKLPSEQEVNWRVL